MRACRMSVFSVTGDTPTDRGEINTTQRHHFRPPRAAVFNRRQHVLRASSEAACWSLSRYVCIVLANMPSEFCGRRRTPASGGAARASGAGFSKRAAPASVAFFWRLRRTCPTLVRGCEYRSRATRRATPEPLRDRHGSARTYPSQSAGHGRERRAAVRAVRLGHRDPHSTFVTCGVTAATVLRAMSRATVASSRV
jgi:hypothetical protein